MGVLRQRLIEPGRGRGLSPGLRHSEQRRSVFGPVDDVALGAPRGILESWDLGDRLRRAVRLRIEANPGAGYRTYSRNTVSSERAGDWRVELRSADGTMLHEERFTVR